MTLTRVTISGADDAVDPRELVHLSAVYPFVEWGILFSQKRTGTARYPSKAWVESLVRSWDDSPRYPFHLSAHLCGAAARETIAGDDWWLDGLNARFGRVQLNGFSMVEPGLIRLLQSERHAKREFILQVRDGVSFAEACTVALTPAIVAKVAALWDESGGRGIADRHRFLSWPTGLLLRVGKAGGINLSNIVEAGKAAAIRKDETWLDLETGARTPDDKWDSSTVRAILAAVNPYVGPAGPCPNHRNVMLLPFEGCAICANST